VYITAEAIARIEDLYGAPVEIVRSYEMTLREFEVVRRSRKFGRSHDVTLFIIEDDKVAVIKKPMYPPGAWRAPSGGVALGEDFESGALREAYEETGLRIALRKYLLRAQVRFTCQGDAIDWTTHVFSAHRVGGELEPVDTHEIAAARFASVAELKGSIRDALIESGSTGLRYRAELGDMILDKLMEAGDLSRPPM
jgi:8-oxo-dGTP pyrophosphatase MutT (NUDIX family)